MADHGIHGRIHGRSADHARPLLVAHDRDQADPGALDRRDPVERMVAVEDDQRPRRRARSWILHALPVHGSGSR